MSDKAEDRRAHPAVRTYTVVGLIALLVMIVEVVPNGLEWWGLVMVLIAIVALVTLWRVGPAVLLGCLTCLLVAQARSLAYLYGSRPLRFDPADLILCGAALAFVVSHYRLQSLVHNVFPLEPSRRKGKKVKADWEPRKPPAFLLRHPPSPPPSRSPGLVTPWEIGHLVLMLPVWTLAAFVVWARLALQMPELEVSLPVWRLWLVSWMLGLTLAVLGTLFGYLRRALASPEENLLYLQDQVWRQTRSEQSRINRWLMWARRRGQRRKERP
jgi:hypothetical protein